MHFKKKGYLILLLALLCNLSVYAQVCNGSLGDPVFTLDFGSGNTPVAPVTDYAYVAGSCPDDGQYALSKTETGCHDDTWHRVFNDHTGNNGYMMVVNADQVAGKQFFSYSLAAGILCQATTYEFSAYILNLLKPGQAGAIKPNITFIIEKKDGTELKRQTFDIPETADPSGWVKYGLYFDSQGETSVVIRMVNNAQGGNGNDFLLDDITFRACGPIIKAGFAGDVNVTRQDVCEGQPASFTITAQAATGYNAPRYQWQQNLNQGNGWENIAGEVNPALLQRNFPSAQLGIYQYRLGVAEGDNINSANCRVYSNPVTINVSGYPPPPASTTLQVCEGEELRLGAISGATYTWSGPNLPPTTQNPIVIPHASAANAGVYHLVITSAAGCSTPADVTVTVNPKPIVTISPPQQICTGSNTTLSAFAADAVTYSWSPAIGLSDVNSANPVASPSVSTLYTVTVTNANNCVSTNSVQVDVLPVPVANAGSDKKIFEGQSVTLDGSAIGDITSYKWTPADYLDNPNSLTPVATPPFDITYTLTVTSANNCGIDQKQVFIRVYNKIVIPTTFTPNSDGRNDIWNIEALETYPQSLISIFNRGGKQVFQSRGYGKPWDGKLNGSPLPTGTYYYTIDFKGEMPTLSGWVMLLR